MTVNQLLAALLRGTMQDWQVIAALEGAPNNYSASAAQYNVQSWQNLAATNPAWKQMILDQNPLPAPAPAPPPEDSLLHTPVDYTQGGQNQMVNANTQTNYDPYISYLERLGISTKPAQTWNPAERYRENLYDPFQKLYGIQQRFAAAPVSARGSYTPYGTLNDYLGGIGGQTGTNQLPLYSQAQRFLSTIFGSTPEQRAELGATYQPGTALSKEGENVFDPNNIGELQDLLRLGLASKFGTQGARYIAGRAPAEQLAFQGQQAAGQQSEGMSFIDYLKQRYGL